MKRFLQQIVGIPPAQKRLPQEHLAEGPEGPLGSAPPEVLVSLFPFLDQNSLLALRQAYKPARNLLPLKDLVSQRYSCQYVPWVYQYDKQPRHLQTIYCTNTYAIAEWILPGFESLLVTGHDNGQIGVRDSLGSLVNTLQAPHNDKILALLVLPDKKLASASSGRAIA